VRGEKRMGGLFGLVERKGSGVFKEKGHWAMQPLCVVTQIFSLYSINNGEFG